MLNEFAQIFLNTFRYKIDLTFFHSNSYPSAVLRCELLEEMDKVAVHIAERMYYQGLIDIDIDKQLEAIKQKRLEEELKNKIEDELFGKALGMFPFLLQKFDFKFLLVFINILILQGSDLKNLKIWMLMLNHKMKKLLLMISKM